MSCLLRVAFQEHAHAIGQLAHAPEEEAALGDERHPGGVAGGQALQGVWQVAEGGCQVALGGREPRHTPFGDEGADVVTGDVAPPAATATRRNTHADTRLEAMTMAGRGAAQKFFTSAPDASVSPVVSATALARLPPPRW